MRQFSKAENHSVMSMPAFSACIFLLDHPFMHAIFLNDIGKVYKFAPMDSEQANKAFAQIRDDYF